MERTMHNEQGLELGVLLVNGLGREYSQWTDRS
jgi:hypothetical protein